jgi:hypothetical protein
MTASGSAVGKTARSAGFQSANLRVDPDADEVKADQLADLPLDQKQGWGVENPGTQSGATVGRVHSRYAELNWESPWSRGLHFPAD